MAKVIYIVGIEDPFEVEGAFDDKGELVRTWCCDDATWRHEYFNGLMADLDITVKDPTAKMRRKMESALRKHWKD